MSKHTIQTNTQCNPSHHQTNTHGKPLARQLLEIPRTTRQTRTTNLTHTRTSNATQPHTHTKHASQTSRLSRMRTSSGITAYVPRAYQNLAVSLPREYRARVLCKPISSSRAARDSILRGRCVRVCACECVCFYFVFV